MRESGSANETGQEGETPPGGAGHGVVVVDDSRFDAHASPGGGHPERPERLHAARRALSGSGVRHHVLGARPASDDEILRVHTSAYLDELRALRGRSGQLDADTYLAAGSVDAAEAAAGSICALVDAMFGQGRRRGLALVRPPGHHARPSEAMGFCLLNNVAIGAAHARARGLERVLVVDWDVHHGNGTQESFFADPHVLFVSLHQWPFYPGTGAAAEVGQGDGDGYTLNVPLSAGASSADYEAAFERIVLPVAEAYAPELVLVSAGFDAHLRDPLGGMNLDAGTYGFMTARLRSIADRFASGRIALVLEGGYDLVALESSLAACLLALDDQPVTGPIDPADPLANAASKTSRARSALQEDEIELARAAAARTWSVCR